VFTRVIGFLNEYLRINAVRRMFSIVEVKKSEIASLVFFAVLFAFFEGMGLSLLLPILQFAESGETAITTGSGIVWSTIARFTDLLHLPLTLPVLLGMAFTPILLRQAVFYANAWYAAIVAGRIGMRLRMRALRAVMDADPEFFVRHGLGDIIGVIIHQTNTAGIAVLLVIKQMSLGILMFLYVMILVALSLPLTAITVMFALLISGVVKANMVRSREYGAVAAEVSQRMTARIVERLSLIRLIKLRHQESAEWERIDEYSDEMRLISVKQARLGAGVEVTADPLLMLSVFITLYLGISQFDMSLAQLGLVMFLLNRLNAKVKEFNHGRQMISTNIAGLLLVRDMTQDARASDTIRGGGTVFTGIERNLVFTDVMFEYPPMEGPVDDQVVAGARVLDGISLEIPVGSLTAIVGRSGGGKSTLVELLPRLRDVTGGTITFDGIDIKEFDIGSLRRGIGLLTQSAMLFNDTVRANLVYGLDGEPDEARIRAALEDAYATFVYELPEGLDTGIGDQGVRFSGGERQRIALARILLADTPIIVLDEPTSALDSESESFIQQAIGRLHGRKTIIVIAHRLATVVSADQILVIDGGRIVEQGTHDMLMKNGAAYHRLFASQLMGADPGQDTGDTR